MESEAKGGDSSLQNLIRALKRSLSSALRFSLCPSCNSAGVMEWGGGGGGVPDDALTCICLAVSTSRSSQGRGIDPLLHSTTLLKLNLEVLLNLKVYKSNKEQGCHKMFVAM